jgi:hypothetical protein
MTILTAPIYAGLINGRSVRFFRSPNERPEMPWHVFDDLMQALELPRHFRRNYLQRVQRDFKHGLQSIATPEGILIIAPHWMAQGLVGASIDVGKHTESLREEYGEECGKALITLTQHMPGQVQFEYATSAMLNTLAEGAAACP